MNKILYTLDNNWLIFSFFSFGRDAVRKKVTPCWIESVQLQLPQGGLYSYRDPKPEEIILCFHSKLKDDLPAQVECLSSYTCFFRTEGFGEERITANALFPATSNTTACKHGSLIGTRAALLWITRQKEPCLSLQGLKCDAVSARRRSKSSRSQQRKSSFACNLLCDPNCRVVRQGPQHTKANHWPELRFPCAWNSNPFY